MKLFATTLFVLVPVVGLAAYALPRMQEHDMPKPEKQHSMLQKGAGTWDAVIVMQNMDGTEAKSKGVQTTTKVGDFHTYDVFEGEMMGAPFVGHGMNSYCPIQKKYIGTWADSMSPTPMALMGDYDEAKRELVMKGKGMGMSGKLEDYRTVLNFKDDDHFTFTLFGAGMDGKEMQMIRIEYTRRK